jgi:hypothetical protein
VLEGRARITTADRRARLARRHLLAPSAKVADPVGVADALVALHATDPATVYLSAAARLRRPRQEAVAEALYDDRTLVRLLGMRRTMFVISRQVAAVVQSSSAVALAAGERRKLVALIEESGLATDGEAWLGPVEAATLAAIRSRPRASATEIAKLVPALHEKVSFSETLSYGLSRRVLFMLALDGHIVRGRPRGSMISSQHEWSTMDHWLPDGLPSMAPAEARAELVRRWLARYGPGTEADLKWWTGWTLGNVRVAMAAAGAVPVDLDDGITGYVLADDVAAVKAPEPWAALLPALDPTPMGWTGREWYLGPHRAPLFDRSGNVGPTVWWDGRIVGGWAQRKDATLVHRVLEDVGHEALAAIDAAAADVMAFLGNVRVSPRFPTPLQRELSA